MKILIIAAEGDKIQSVSSFLEESKHQVEQVASAIEGNDVILTGLAMGRPYEVIILHDHQDSADTRELIRYWRSQDPFLPLVKVGGELATPDPELIEMGLLDQIPDNMPLPLVKNRFRLIQQSMAIGSTYQLKAELLHGPASLTDPYKALDRALDLILEKIPVNGMSFIAYTAFEHEPIIQIAKNVEAHDQFWLDEVCDGAQRFVEPILMSNRMAFEPTDPARYIYPITTDRGWEGVLIFFAAGPEHQEISSALAGQFATIADGVETMLGHVRSRLELKQARASKSEYMEILSDRIRQPISDLMSTAELLVMVGTEDPIRGLTTKMAHHAQMATSMLEDVIELGRIDDGMLIIHPRRMSMKKLILRVVEKLDILFAEKEIRVNPVYDEEVDYIVEGDPDKLKKVIAHLLTNAVRFSPEGSKITIRLDVDDDGWVCTSIQDEGVGMSLDQQKLIFERTAGQKHSITEQGIGLYLCRKFITAHEGKLWVESHLGLGSTFYVRIRPWVIPPQDTPQIQ